MKILFFTLVLNIGCGCSADINVEPHNIEMKNIAYVEVIYFKATDGLLRPFRYERDSAQLKIILAWLDSNESGWIRLDKKSINFNSMDTAIDFYSEGGLKLGVTLWRDATTAVLAYEDEDNIKLLFKPIDEGDLVFNLH